MITCLGIAVADCTNKAREGKFTILPILNLAQYKTDGTYEEIDETRAQVVAYLQQIYGDDYFYDTYESDPPWRFINISTALSLCNILLFYALRWLCIKFPRFVRALMLAGCMIALLLILASRIYAQGTYCYSLLERKYPVAFFSLKDIVQAVFIAGAATGLVKLYSFLKKNENRVENQFESEEE